MSKQPEALRDFLLNNVRYQDGNLFWASQRQGRKSGMKLGRAPDKRGYIRTQMLGKNYAVHRLVFLFHHGWMPLIVDHIDGDPSNNKVENLRAATKSGNTCNSKVRSDSASGLKGVHKAYMGHRWIACVRVAGKKWTGSFCTIEEAHQAASTMRKTMHCEFARDK